MTRNNKLTALAIAALLVMTTVSFALRRKTIRKSSGHGPRRASQDKTKKPVNGDRLEPDDTTTRPSRCS